MRTKEYPVLFTLTSHIARACVTRNAEYLIGCLHKEISLKNALRSTLLCSVQSGRFSEYEGENYFLQMFFSKQIFWKKRSFPTS